MAKDLNSVFDEFDKPKPKKEEETSPQKEKEKEEKEEEKETPKEEEPQTESPPEAPPEKEEKKEEDEVPPKEEEKPPEEPTPSKPKEESSPSPPSEIPDKYKKFDFSPAKKSAKHCIVVYGLKGAGKTWLSLSTPGTHFALTFDNRTQAVAGEMKEKNIEVFDGVKYYNRSSADKWLESAEDSWVYIEGILEALDSGWLEDDEGSVIERPDWILVDGGEIVHTMLEMVMRGRNSLMPFQGISNQNIWKERRMYIGQLFQKCMQIAKKGVIWTSYIKKEEIKEEGDYVSIQDIPKWIDAVLYECDTLIKVQRKTGKAGQEFQAIVESSKWKAIPESGLLDVTNKGMSALIKDKTLFDEGE